jgi:hypothetical protein
MLTRPSVVPILSDVVPSSERYRSHSYRINQHWECAPADPQLVLVRFVLECLIHSLTVDLQAREDARGAAEAIHSRKARKKSEWRGPERGA